MSQEKTNKDGSLCTYNFAFGLRSEVLRDRSDIDLTRIYVTRSSFDGKEVIHIDNQPKHPLTLGISEGCLSKFAYKKDIASAIMQNFLYQDAAALFVTPIGFEKSHCLKDNGVGCTFYKGRVSSIVDDNKYVLFSDGKKIALDQLVDIIPIKYVPKDSTSVNDKYNLFTFVSLDGSVKLTTQAYNVVVAYSDLIKIHFKTLEPLVLKKVWSNY